jgi:uncharacterized membrane protein YcaP (DUF421 family)
MGMAHELLTLSWRTAVLWVLALFVFRAMGKRTLAKMGAFDFAVIIMIGEAMAIGMEDVKTPLLNAVVVVVALGLLQFILTWLNVRLPLLERATQGSPTELVRNGQVNRAAMRRERISSADLMMELRRQGITDIRQVKLAYLEPTGSISVQKASGTQSPNSRAKASQTPANGAAGEDGAKTASGSS